jgi:hypothetical protein
VRVAPSWIEASVRSLRACGPSFACLAIPRRRAASKSPRSPIAADMANLPLFAMLNQISAVLGIPPRVTSSGSWYKATRATLRLYLKFGLGDEPMMALFVNRHPVALLARRDDPQRVVRQWPLQRRRFADRACKPRVPFFGRRAVSDVMVTGGGSFSFSRHIPAKAKSGRLSVHSQNDVAGTSAKIPRRWKPHRIIVSWRSPSRATRTTGAITPGRRPEGQEDCPSSRG